MIARSASSSRQTVLAILLVVVATAMKIHEVSAFSLHHQVPTLGNLSQKNYRIGAKGSPVKLLASTQPEADFDKILEDNKLREATSFLKSNPQLELSRERFNKIFDVIVERTSEADENAVNTRREQEQPLMSKARMEMTDMYNELGRLDHLRLFGGITKENMPASGSHSVSPNLLEKVTLLSMNSLTPKPSNNLLWAGAALAVLEGIASMVYGLNINLLFFVTFAAALGDRIILNGAIQESIAKILTPGTQQKITKHEAGHFLIAYLLGCPVEGFCLSAWAALADSRFSTRAVSAGTSFFDPILSKEIGSQKITRSSIDRYSIIVMAGIAAEAVNYGQADGGSSDEMALIQFLSQMNGGNPSNPAWNDITIRNQARWGAMQAVLLLREYKECYEALVDALERGGTLGDCIYAIENAGRESGKLPLKKPLGYILEKDGWEEDWVTELPEPVMAGSSSSTTASVGATSATATLKKEEVTKIDPEQSLEQLRAYKEEVEQRLKSIDEKLGKFQ